MALVVKNPFANAREKRCRFNSCIRKIPWERKWQPTPVRILLGKPQGQRSLVSYSPGGCRESDASKWAQHTALICSLGKGPSATVHGLSGTIHIFCFSPAARQAEAALNMPADLENSAVATALEKVSFYSNPKEGQCQRVFKLLHNCSHLTC